jgi:hypothetical protein
LVYPLLELENVSLDFRPIDSFPYIRSLSGFRFPESFTFSRFRPIDSY